MKIENIFFELSVTLGPMAIQSDLNNIFAALGCGR